MFEGRLAKYQKICLSNPKNRYVCLRKQRRVEEFSRKRRIHHNESSSIFDISNIPSERIQRALESTDDLFAATETLEILRTQRDLPKEITASILNCLKTQDLVYPVCVCLVDLACSEKAMQEKMFEVGIIPQMKNILLVQEYAHLALRCITNLSSESINIRKSILSSDILTIINDTIYTNRPEFYEAVGHFLHSMSSLLKDIDIYYLRMMTQWLLYIVRNNEPVTRYDCLAFLDVLAASDCVSYLVSNEEILAFVYGTLHSSCGSLSIVTSLRIIGNLIIESDIQPRIITKLLMIIDKSPRVKYHVFWIFGVLFKKYMLKFDDKVLVLLINALCDTHNKVRLQAVSTLKSIARKADTYEILKLIHNDLLLFIRESLVNSDDKTRVKLLQIVDEVINKSFPVPVLQEELFESLEELAFSKNAAVSSLALHIISYTD